MPVYMLNEILAFPDPAQSNEDGLLAVGGDLEPQRLLLAYENGIFPWYDASNPILWWSPDPRCVIPIDGIKVSKSMRNVLNQGKFKITFDQDFENVVKNCANVPRAHEEGTWITDDILAAYTQLHHLGVAHSVEVWHEGDLCGGLYGIALGRMFCGESMFALKSNASKTALIYLHKFLKQKDFQFIDCQITNPHLESLGAVEIPRKEFIGQLNKALTFDSLLGNWGSLFPEST